MITRIDKLSELSNIDVAFWVYSKSEKYFEYISPRCSHIFESDISKISDISTFRKIVHPDDQIKVIKNINGGNIGNSSEIIFRIITSNGTIKWLKNISIEINKNNKNASTVVGFTFVINNETDLNTIHLNEKSVLKSLPDSYVIINKYCEIIKENIYDAEKLIFDNIMTTLLGKNIFTTLNQSIKDIIHEKIKDIISNQSTKSFEVNIEKQNQREWFEIRMISIQEEAIFIIIRNITETQTRINKVEKFFNIIEQSQDIVMITDVNGIIEYVNSKACSISGYNYGELIGKKATILKSGKHETSFYIELWDTILKGNSFKAEFYNKKKDGDYFIEEKIITPFSNNNGEITNFISTGRDVTKERKDEQKANKYKQLQITIDEKEQKTRTLSLIKSNEIERKKFAKEIHEGLNQMLSAAMANLDSIISKKVISSNEKEKIEFINHIVSEIINELRGISANLSPINLYEFGLFKVIHQIVTKFNNNSKNIFIDFSSNISGIRFKTEIEINIFRIIQEAIQNIDNHADANKINLEINYINSTLTLSIKDNGKGINMNILEFKKMNTYGILNIEARSKSIGGILDIKSKKDEGFQINLSITTKSIIYD